MAYVNAPPSARAPAKSTADEPVEQKSRPTPKSQLKSASLGLNAKSKVAPKTASQFLQGIVPPKWTRTSKLAREGIVHSKLTPPKPFVNKPTPGLPPPPAKLLGNEHKVAMHNYRWMKSTTIAAHFRPDRNTMMISGRPMQASL